MSAELLERICQPVEKELTVCRGILKEALKTNTPLLSLALEHLVKRSGKQMRPILTLLSAKGWTNDIPESVYHAAVAFELLHTASLVHDDVVDESDRRRGQKSINSLLDNKAAVLVGDYILSKALEHATLTKNVEVVNLVSRLGQTLAEGELLQLANTESKDFSISSYYAVVRKKTASLFSACAEAGAVLAGGDKGYRQRMMQFGMLLGTCFQLRDDIFDYDANHDVGKPAGNDMQEGKLTLPVLYVAGKNPEAARLALMVREGRASKEEINQLVALTIKEDGILYAERAMDDLISMASGLVCEIHSNGVGESLSSYLDFVCQRNL